MEKFIKTHRVVFMLLTTLIVVGLVAGCTSDKGDNINSSAVETTNPTTKNPTDPSTEPHTVATTTPTTNPITDTPTTEPTVTFTDVNETVYATGTVNIRSGPDEDCEKLGSLSKGESVKRIAVGNNGWSRVEYNGKTAYIYSSYLSTTKPSDTTSSSGNSKASPTETTAGNYVGRADPSTGLSWDGVSPIIYTYPDGTTGTEPREGATYEVVPGVTSTYTIPCDAVGREKGSICPQCGKEIQTLSSGKYCKQTPNSHYCGQCGSYITAYTCHTCKNYMQGIYYCEDCGRISGNDGSNGKCVNWLTGGNHTCPACGANVPGYTCHTCDEE